MFKLKNKVIEKTTIVNITVFIVFLLFSLLIGCNHEPWIDEAQSWIIARDASVGEIIWELARYEGTMPLWQLTIKLFIKLGLTYDYFFIIPIVISLIGLIVFLKKVDAPIFVKVLLPFSYYIFYQYTIIARSYCYLLLAFSLLLITYKKRMEKPLQYILALSFLSFISMHGTIIFFVLGILFFIEKMKQKELKKCIKEIFLFSIICIIEAMILFPSSDLYMTVSVAFSIPEILISIFEIITTSGNVFQKVYNTITFLILLYLFIKVCFVKNKDIPIVTGIVFLFMFIIRFASHHGGIIFYLMIFGVIAYYDELKEKDKYFDKIAAICLILYCILSIQSGVKDFSNQYSGAKEMANYIKENKYDEKDIYGFGFIDISLQPYFDKNLFKNMDEAIYRWSSNNKDFYIYCNFQEYKREDFSEVPEYIVINWAEDYYKYEMINEMIMGTDKYEVEYKTLGHKFFKNHFDSTEGFILYRLK